MTKKRKAGLGEDAALPAKLYRQPRGRAIPAGTLGQEVAGLRIFQQFLKRVDVDETALFMMNSSSQSGAVADAKNFYSLLTAFSIHLQNSSSEKARSDNKLFAKATVYGYFSQAVNFLRERYPFGLTDSKRFSVIRDKMGAAIDERNLRANIQTNDAPGCTAGDLKALVDSQVERVSDGYKAVHDAAVLIMMWHTFGRAIDTCFARKQQLTMVPSGELFLRVSRLKTSVVHGLSIFKSAGTWQQCALHAIGMLFVCTTEPSEYVFPLIPRCADSEIPGGMPRSQEEGVLFWESLQKSGNELLPQGALTRPNVSKYVNDIINVVYRSREKKSITSKMTSHSIRRGAAAYANGNHKLAVQWISTRGAWLLDSLTKVFAYIGTTTREDQSVGKVLAGYEDPSAPVVTPSFVLLSERLPPAERDQAEKFKRELFRNVHGFSDQRMNVTDTVLDAAFAALLIHVEAVVQQLRATGAEPTLYERRLSECMLLATNAQGFPLTIRQVYAWGDTLRKLWREANYQQLGTLASGTEPAIVTLLTQLLAKTEALERTVALLTAEKNTQAAIPQVDSLSVRTVSSTPPETASLAGAFYAWYSTRLWEPGTGRREQATRCEYKTGINIMLALATEPTIIPPEPPRSTITLHDAWKQQVWIIAKALDANANAVLVRIDSKRKTKQPAALRKRWAELRKVHPSEYTQIVLAYLNRLESGTVVDRCTPMSHQWRAPDFPTE